MSSGISVTLGAARPGVRVRWIIFAFLCALSFVAYMQRAAISIAADRMMPELGLTQLQIGWLETAFLVSYAALQFPGGVLGQFLGSRYMLTLCGGVAVLATAAAPVLPSLAGGGALFAGLLLAQFGLGAAQAPFFAVLTGALERWFPPRQWALTQGISSGGAGLGSAVAPPLIASLMVALGWRKALLIVALPAVALLAAWWQYARDAPAQHARVTTAELAELDYAAESANASPLEWQRLRSLLLNRHLCGLTLSYAFMNFVFYLISFWSFLYLVQARHFTVLDGGMAAIAPPLGGALGAGALGFAQVCTARERRCTVPTE